MIEAKRVTALVLDDPQVIAYRHERMTLYRQRAEKALAEEGTEPTGLLLGELSSIGFSLEAGGEPNLLQLALRGHKKICDRVNCDAERISGALTQLIDSINKSARVTTFTLSERIKAKGISIGDAEKILNALADTVKEMAQEPRPAPKQGNTKAPRSGWALEAWKLLKKNGLGMRPAARVIANIFDGTEENYESIYQAIRNSEIR